MRVRRLALPVLLVAAYAYVRSSPSPRPAVDEDMPQAAETYTVTDAPESIEELRQRIARDPRARAHRGRRDRARRSRTVRSGSAASAFAIARRARRWKRDTVFRVGSLSKSVIALGVMRLVDQGKLDVDRPLREILPDVGIDNPWEDVAPVTLAQCLEHTAGFDDMRFNEIFTTTSASRCATRSRSTRDRAECAGARGRVTHTRMSATPSRRARSRSRAASRSTTTCGARSWHRWASSTPTSRARRSLAPRLATGYMDGDRADLFRAFAHRPAGGLLASASDLAKLVHFWLVRGEGYPPIVSRAGLDRIERSGTLPYPHIDAEYGFAQLQRRHASGDRATATTAACPAFTRASATSPISGVGYVLLLNSNYTFRGYFEIRSLLFAYLTQGRSFPPPALSQFVERPGASFFTLESPRNEIFGFVERATGGCHVSERGTRFASLISPGSPSTSSRRATAAIARPAKPAAACGSRRTATARRSC